MFYILSFTRNLLKCTRGVVVGFISHMLAQGSHRVMGYFNGERWLANPVFKVPDAAMADQLDTECDRLFHHAFLNLKLPCPHPSCKKELGKIVFEESGLSHHYRVKHIGTVNEKWRTREARRLLKYKHGEETKKHLLNISTQRSHEIYFLLFLIFWATFDCFLSHFSLPTMLCAHVIGNPGLQLKVQCKKTTSWKSLWKGQTQNIVMHVIALTRGWHWEQSSHP